MSAQPAESPIRRARPEDAPQILAVINDTNRVQYSDIVPPDVYRDPFMDLDDLLRRMSLGRFFVYREGERIVGVVGLQALDGQAAKVSRLYVLPEAQRRGIGAALLTRAEGEARAMGVREIRLHVVEKAAWAHAFYDRMGYDVRDTLERPRGRVVLRCKRLQESA